MGCLPMRDMVELRSGDRADHFATDPAGAALAVREDALIGRDDADSKAPARAGQVVDAAVAPATRGGEAFDRGHQLLAFGAVAQAHVDGRARSLGLDLVALDVALALERIED